MVTATQRRAAADYLRETYAVSQRRAGAVLGRARSTLRYRPRLVWRAGPLSPAADSFVAMARSRYAPAHPVPKAP